jgi:Na+/phosphate symporter
MHGRSSFNNPLRSLAHERDANDFDAETAHTRTVSNSARVDEGLIVIISKLVEMVKLLTQYFSGSPGSHSQTFSRFAGEVHEQSQILTEALLVLRHDEQSFNRLIRFPFLLERVGKMLENILECSQAITPDDTKYSEKAFREQEQIFVILLDILKNLRDSLQNPSKEALLAVSFQGKRLEKMVQQFAGANGERVRAGECPVKSSARWNEILDSAKSADEYLMEMVENLLDMGKPEH